MAADTKKCRWVFKHMLFCTCLILLLLYLHAEFYEYAADDAFIHFRVARNLFESGNPYFNHDEPLKVSTSSGWTVFVTMIISFAHWFGQADHLPIIVAMANAMILFLILHIYTRIIESALEEPLSIKLKLLFQIPCLAILLPSSIQLMETPLALLISGIGIYSILKRNAWGFLLLGVAVYFRIELIVPLVLAAIFVFVQKQYKLKQILFPIFAGLLPFVFYDLYFFQTVVPHSVVAKASVYSFTYLNTFLNTLFAALPTIKGADDNVFLYLTGVIPCIVFFYALLLTVLLTLKERVLTKNFWPLFFGLASLLIIAGYIYGRAFMFDWYRPIYMLPALLCCFISMFSLSRAIRRMAMLAVCIIFVLSFLSIAQMIYASIGNRSVFPLFAMGSRVKTYLAVARVLNDEYPGATLLTSEIGGIGYSFRGKIYDAVGLASADAVAFHPMQIPEQRARGDIGAIPPGYVQAKQPDIIVSHDIFAKALQASEVIKLYNVLTIPVYRPEDAEYSEFKALWQSRYLKVYIHKRLPITANISRMAVSDVQ
ncbi:MAG: hypothetical protein ACD_39C01131G0003 [uncultured bacterium]|nr:MAG: hypothetical protein ACD_39C01131G0003 [uncultured bacterium]